VNSNHKEIIVKKTAPRKLTLCRETLAELTDKDVWNARGGAEPTTVPTDVSMSRRPDICCA
jgi:hypothetical protein